MKILLVNKFLYPKGGSETFVIQLGEVLAKNGHEVQYFGMENPKNILKNQDNIYVKEKNFSQQKMKYILTVPSLIYNLDAKRKMTKLLNSYQPDLIILNNIEYHLTPSIIVSIGKYKKKHDVKLFYVAHDYQLVCPSHGLFDVNINPCEKCLTGSYFNCFKTKCMKNSRLKSLVASLDSFYWHKRNVYQYVDKIICPSNFLKRKLDTHTSFKDKTVVIHNFVTPKEYKKYPKEDYVLYFGALKKDKGVATLLEVCKRNPKIQFVFAGYGELEEKINQVPNATCVGFKVGKDLEKIISQAKMSICPSEMYENCPFSVIESQQFRTPVICSNMGGIPELISIGKTGLVFKAGDSKDLEEKILTLWNNPKLLEQYSENCEKIQLETTETYYQKIMNLYNSI